MIFDLLLPFLSSLLSHVPFNSSLDSTNITMSVSIYSLPKLPYAYDVRLYRHAEPRDGSG
jgi:hypothetical protein